MKKQKDEMVGIGRGTYIEKKQRLRKGIDFDGWMVKWSGDRQWHTHVWLDKKPEKTPDWEIHRVKIIDLGVVK